MATLIPNGIHIESSTRQGLVSATDQIALWRDYTFFATNEMQGFAISAPDSPKGFRLVSTQAFDLQFSGPFYHIGWGLGECAGAEYTTTASEAFLKSRMVQFPRWIAGITPPPIQIPA